MPREILLFALPMGVAFVMSILVAPLVIRVLKRGKVGQTIQEDGPESHFSKAGTPTMGGIIIIVGILAGVAATLIAGRGDAFFFSGFTIGAPSGLGRLIAVLALMLAYGLLGAVDDYLTIHPIGDVRGIASKPKAIIQLLLAAGFVFWLRQSGCQPILSVGGQHFYLGEAYWILALFFIAGMANFVNITDGLDGLVSGLVAVAFAGLLSSLMYGYLMMVDVPGAPYSSAVIFAPVVFATIGACVAFLWFNTNPARVFMGDTGSLALGALLPAVAIMLHREVLMIVLGLVFILDGFSTIIQWAVFKFTRITTGTGKRVFLKSPVHHHFELMGWPEQTVVVRFWICGVIAAMLGYVGMALGWW